MKYYLVAGEASGDLHGANLMKALKIEDQEAEFRFFGGDKMQAEGGELVKHYADMAFMGFTEVVMNLRNLIF
jgi:lipid-A-disaccharide synthase